MGRRVRFLWVGVGWLSLLCGCVSNEVAENENRKNAEASRIYVQKGIQYMENGQMDVALHDLQHATLLDDGNVSAHNALAVFYDRTRQMGEAEKQFQRALALDADNPATLNNYGQFLCREGQYARAQDFFDKAGRDALYATPWIVLTNAGVCARLSGRAPQAETKLREALRLNGRFSPALLEMASIKLDEGMFLDARSFFQRYETASQPSAAALLIGARIAQGLNDQNAYEAYVRDLLKRFPESREAGMVH